MHKNQINICILVLLMLISLCIFTNSKLIDMQNRKKDILNQREKITKLSNEISSRSFEIHESQCDSRGDLKSIIKKITAKNDLKNVLLKKSTGNNDIFKITNLEIKFLSPHEKNIYDFIDSLMKEFSAFIIFDLIKVMRNNEKKFIAKIECRFVAFKKSAHRKCISIEKSMNEAISTKSINIFPSNKVPIKYTLFCVVNNSKAFINNAWMKIGDCTENFKIKHIYQKSIDVEHGSEISNIKIGDTWYHH